MIRQDIIPFGGSSADLIFYPSIRCFSEAPGKFPEKEILDNLLDRYYETRQMVSKGMPGLKNFPNLG
jgi:hypothetical protein